MKSSVFDRSNRIRESPTSDSSGFLYPTNKELLVNKEADTNLFQEVQDKLNRYSEVITDCFFHESGFERKKLGATDKVGIYSDPCNSLTIIPEPTWRKEGKLKARRESKLGISLAETFIATRHNETFIKDIDFNPDICTYDHISVGGAVPQRKQRTGGIFLKMNQYKSVHDQSKSIEDVIQPALEGEVRGSASLAQKESSYLPDAFVDEAFSDFASLVSPNGIIKIRFANREEAGKGLIILLDRGDSITGYRGGLYGVTSEEQVRMLERHNVEFDRIK